MRVMRFSPESIPGFFRKNRIIAFVFIFSLSFFIYQHSTGFSWDFASYVLNAKYWAGHGYYFEWARPPLAPLMLLPLGFLGWAAAEYAYIIIVTLLHLYSSLKFSERSGVDKTAFYVFSMSVFTLLLGFKMGTELLSLALVQLFLSHLHEKRGAIFYSLSVLARYTNINFIVFFIFQRKIKKILASCLIAALALSPWLALNFMETGNPLASVLDSYLLNYKFRSEAGIASPFLATDILFAFNFTLALLIPGMLSGRGKNYHAMLLMLALAVVSYATVPLKEERYLFSVITPAAYFSAAALRKIRFRSAILCSFVILTAASLFLMPAQIRDQESGELYRLVAGKSLCATKSNVWVALNYFGASSQPYPEKTQVESALNENYTIVLFKSPKYPDYVNNGSFIRQFPVMEETPGYVIIGNASKCRKPERFELLFAERVMEYYRSLGRSATYCETAFSSGFCGYLHMPSS